MNNNILSTLFICIDVSSKTYVLCALDFQGNKLLNLEALNNQPGAESILDSILDCLNSNSFKYVVIADFAICGRITTKPWSGSQFLALQRLTCHRLHLIECISRKKTYMISNIYLKYSQLAVLDKKDRPFSYTYGATSAVVLTEF